MDVYVENAREMKNGGVEIKRTAKVRLSPRVQEVKQRHTGWEESNRIELNRPRGLGEESTAIWWAWAARWMSSSLINAASAGLNDGETTICTGTDFNKQQGGSNEYQSG